MEWSELNTSQESLERHHELAGRVADHRWRDRMVQERQRKIWWFWLFFWMMPLGFLAPCLSAIAINNQDYTSIAAPIAILLPFVGLGGIMLMGGDSQGNKTLIAMYDTAVELNLTYAPEPTDTYWPNFLKKCLMYQNVRGKFTIGNSYFGNYQGVDVLFISWCARNDNEVSYSSVLIIPDSVVGTAEFVVCQRSWFTRTMQWLKGQPEIEASHLEEFAKDFAIISQYPNKEPILKSLTPEFTHVCQTYSAYVVELRSGHLLINKPLTEIKPEHIQEYLDAGLEFLRVLRRS